MKEHFMGLALAQAKKAWALGEVPVGCVIVRDGQVIGEGYNRRETDKTVLGHAELMAMRQAEAAIGDWRLSDCTLYVTLEPCPMCAGAIMQSRLGRLVYGVANPTQGCAGSLYRIPEDPAFPHFCPCDGGVLERECQHLLDRFFDSRRD